MGKYGGPISAVAGTIAPLLMKKPDPNEKPYKKGTKNLNTNMKNKKSLISVESKRIYCDICNGRCKRGLAGNNPNICTNLNV